MINTPESIETLEDDEIFVFGSNTAGRHGRGAAKTALDKFGAEYGVGEGPTGRCYAFPTLDGNLRQRSLSDLRASADLFIDYAICTPYQTFWLTRVGCGLAGYADNLMAELFRDAPDNVIKPFGW